MPSSRLIYNIATILVHWLIDARYQIQHRGVQTWIHASRGVRQGCKASPLEWTAFLLRVIAHIGQQLTTGAGLTFDEWLRQHLLAYVDYLLFRWEIKSCLGLQQRFLAQVARIIDTLESFGLSISMDKTVILLRLVGEDARSQLKRLLVCQQGSRWMAIQRSSVVSWIKVVNTHVYLGVCISFGAFEKRTLKHRLTIGHAAFKRLRKWSVGKHKLSI